MATRGKLFFMTWNTCGLKSKIKDVMTEIEKHKCHVAFIQETHIGKKDESVFSSVDNWKSVFTTYTSQSKGVAILIRKDILSKSKIFTRKDTTGCYVAVKCTLKGQLYTLVSMYTHQIDSRPLKKLRNILEDFAEGILLIGGDFNIALNPHLDRNSSTNNERHLMLRPTVEKFLTSFHLVDVWRRLNPTCRKYTYSDQSRLDYLLVPEESMHCVESCKISVDDCCSDHKPVLFKISCHKINTSNQLDVIENTDKRNISEFMSEVSQQWLRCKEDLWGQKFDLTFSQNSFDTIQVKDVERAIQSLAVNKNKNKRPDGISLLFYKSYSYALIPYLCVFYHNLLKQTMNVPKSFNKTYNAPQTHIYIFNVDYLILSTIMGWWLNEHLDSHSSYFTVEKTDQKVLFAFKKGSKMIPWQFLQRCLTKEQKKEERSPPLQSKFNIDVLEKLLKNSPEGRYKLLRWGCPLTPVLMRLCLMHVAEKFLESVRQPESEVHMCKANVIVKLPENVSEDYLRKAEKELPTVHCRFVNELTDEQSE